MEATLVAFANDSRGRVREIYQPAEKVIACPLCGRVIDRFLFTYAGEPTIRCLFCIPVTDLVAV